MIEVKWWCECGGVEIKVFVDGGAEDGAGKVCELNRRLFEMKGLGGGVTKIVIHDGMELDVMSTLKCMEG